MSSRFGWLDAAIIISYLLILAGIGVYFSRKQKNLEDFFLAGRSMGWVPVGMSLMAALNSGIDYLMEPFKVFTYGLIFIFTAVSWIFLYPWVAYVTLPFYRRLNVYTAYEYLEARFDGSVRTLAASIFLLWRLGWMATAIYVPSLAISATTGLSLGATIVVLGGMVTLYATPSPPSSKSAARARKSLEESFHEHQPTPVPHHHGSWRAHAVHSRRFASGRTHRLPKPPFSQARRRDDARAKNGPDGV